MPLHLITDKPIAYDSPDHLFPNGTKDDNSANLLFNERLGWCIPISDWRVLDLGCAGGGFVKTVLDGGGMAVGVEGSDYSLLRKRAEWATIPDSLFTADAAAPFEIVDEAGQRARFNVITGWEFLEHVPASSLAGLFDNIERHLAAGGICIFSVNTQPSSKDEIEYHQTAQPKEWWLNAIKGLGFCHHEKVVPIFGRSWIRGAASVGSFHLVLTRRDEPLTFAEKISELSRRAHAEERQDRLRYCLMQALARFLPPFVRRLLKRSRKLTGLVDSTLQRKQGGTYGA